jgi:hypothetical protein
MDLHKLVRCFRSIYICRSQQCGIGSSVIERSLTECWSGSVILSPNRKWFCAIDIQINFFRQHLPGTDLNQPRTRKLSLVSAGDVGHNFSGELYINRSPAQVTDLTSCELELPERWPGDLGRNVNCRPIGQLLLVKKST